jgi:hypothetical protein
MTLAMTRRLTAALLLAIVSACSSASETQGSVVGSVPSSNDIAVGSTTIPLECPEGQHLETEGTSAGQCVIHPPDWTGDVQPVDPDQSAIDLTNSLVTDPQRFADIITGISPSITEVDDIQFTLTNPDVGSAGISFGVTTSATTDAERDDVAWSVVFAIADLWGPGGGFRNETGQVRTGVSLMVDSVQYVASMEMMMQVYDFTISQEDFIAASRRA